MKTIKGLFAILFALILVIGTLASCAQQGNPTGTTKGTENATGGDTTAADTTTPLTGLDAILAERDKVPSSLPTGLDFQGETITIHTRTENYITEFIFCDYEETSDSTSRLVYERNEYVAELLSVDLAFLKDGEWNTYNQALSNMIASINAGDRDFDIVFCYTPAPLVLNNLCVNLAELKYLDFENPWWNSTICQDLQINGNVYLCNGDIDLLMITSAYGYFFNKTLQTDYQVEDLYQVVKDGEWTIDKLREVTMKFASGDVNGNGILETDDVFGLALEPSDGNTSDNFFESSHMEIVEVREDGIYLKNDATRLMDLCQKLYDLHYNTPGVLLDTRDDNLGNFTNDQLFIWPATIGSVRGEKMREMDSDYGLLPSPKYDAAQEEYYTRVQDAVHKICVPITAEQDAASAVMEALAMYGYKVTSPKFIENEMKIKYSRDEEGNIGNDAYCLDLIRNGAYFCFENVYASFFDGHGYLRNMMSTKSQSFASDWESIQGKLQGQLNTVNDRLYDLDVEIEE